MEIFIGAIAIAFAAGAVITGGLGAAATAVNPFLNDGVSNASVAGHNDFAAGSADVLNGLQLPGIPEFNFN